MILLVLVLMDQGTTNIYRPRRPERTDLHLQDLRQRAKTFTREMKRGRVRFGRNSPCPCGSGNKYKKCCLGK